MRTILAVLVVCACGPVTEPTPSVVEGDAGLVVAAEDGGPPDAGGPADAAVAPDAAVPDDAGAPALCGVTVANDGPLVAEAAGEGTPPQMAGGTIPGGTYTLQAIRRYGSAPTPVSIRHQFRVTGAAFQEAMDISSPSGTLSVAVSGAFTVTDSTWRFTAQCPGAQWNANGEHTWEGGRLIMAAESSGGSMLVSEYSFTP